MIDVISRVEAAVSADRAWNLLGGFDNLPLWVPMIQASILEDGGRIRRLTLADGGSIVERLRAFDNRERFYTHDYILGPDPVENYIGKVAVEEHERDRCVLVWSGRFKPLGLSDATARQRYGDTYRSALEHAKALLESSDAVP